MVAHAGGFPSLLYKHHHPAVSPHLTTAHLELDRCATCIESEFEGKQKPWGREQQEAMALSMKILPEDLPFPSRLL